MLHWSKQPHGQDIWIRYRDWKCLYAKYCVISHSLTGACSVFQVLGVAIYAKNNADSVILLLCCEKCRCVSAGAYEWRSRSFAAHMLLLSGSMCLVHVMSLLLAWWFCFKTKEHCFKITQWTSSGLSEVLAVTGITRENMCGWLLIFNKPGAKAPHWHLEGC